MKRSIYRRLEKVEKRLAAIRQDAASRDGAMSVLKWFDEALLCCGIQPLNSESKMGAFCRYLGISSPEIKNQLGLCLGIFKWTFDEAMGYFGIVPLPGESQMDALTRGLGISTLDLKAEPGPRLREFRLTISSSIGSIVRDALAGRLESTAEER
jgi:hypothetical protein